MNWQPRILPVRTFAALALALCSVMVSSTSADDWPMWRFDAERSAASPHSLPDDLIPLWERQFEPRQQAWDDPLNLDLMTYDRLLEPIVSDGRLMIAFNDRDKLLALDASTGDDLWTVYAEAPVRLPPAADRGNVYFCSDDGYLYCVDVATGQLRWKFSGAPGAQHAIGNRRLTSAWPARGGAVVRDQTVYFTSSIWPFMGVFVYALDAETGAVKWVNSSTGAQYIKQPHSAPSFAGVAPQGALVASENLLVVPGGRSVPAVFERADGKLRYFELNAAGKGTGGSFVAMDQKFFYVHTRKKGTRAFQLDNGIKTAFMPNEPVLHEGKIYSAGTSDDGTPVIRAYGQDQKLLWETEADGLGDLILAGDHLVAAGGGNLTMIALPSDGGMAKITEQLETANDIERLLVADDKLFAVTLSGRILAFGSANASADHQNLATVPGDANPAGATDGKPEKPNTDREAENAITEILETGVPEGYAIWYGRSDSELVQSLMDHSKFVQLAVVDPDREAIDQVRRRLDHQNRYGSITIHHSEAARFKPPKYVANMVMVDLQSIPVSGGDVIPSLYESVRPFGGVLYLIGSEGLEGLAEQIEALDLEQAEVELGTRGVIVRRRGALPGSDDWTHQYGNIANTIKSDDRRVRLPLGLLWFGGSSNMDVLPRHGHGPPEQVVGGRLFIQGMNMLSARDVYTGRVLWRREFKDLGTFDVYYDDTYEDTPLDPKYNQVHIPGANGRGTNYVVTEDRVYVVEGSVCHVLDPATGQTVKEISLPGDGPSTSSEATDPANALQWGYIGVYKDVLIGGLGFADYRRRYGLEFEADKELKKSRAGFGAKSFDRAASAALIGFDRYTGEVLWRSDANHSFWHNGIVAGGDQVYCLDRNPKRVEQAMLRRGLQQPDTYRIAALDYRTGELKWEIRDGIFGTWLSYSEEFDLLLQAGASASDRLTDEVAQGMAVYSASDGSLKWKRETLRYTGPCILHHDWIITNTNSYADSAGAFFLLDGRQKMVANPITGEMQPWKLTRAYGCNNIIASENLLTFRSGSAGYYDLLNEGGTGNLGGFKSGCTSNLVVANGVLNAPDYTRTCSCAYQNQTSLALVHMPDIELWSVDTAASVQSHGKRIEGLGINFGAPGDRRDEQGRLWLEYPAVSGQSPPISLRFNDNAGLYQHHSSIHSGQPHPWVLASGLENVTNVVLDMKLRDQYELATGIPVLHAEDDAVEGQAGVVQLDGKGLELVQESTSQLVGIRYNDIQLARDSVIRGAYVQFTCDQPSGETASLVIAAEDVGNAKRFSSDAHDLSSRMKTSVNVVWEPEPWKKAGEAKAQQRTPDLSELIRAVIGRPDWKPGNSIAFLISGSGKRAAAAFRSGDSQAAILVVDAEPGSVAASRAATPVEPYRLRLLFGLPPNSGPRIFDLLVQGKQVRSDITLSPMSKGGTSATEVVSDVMIGDQLQIQLVPKQGKPILSGLELVPQVKRSSQ